MFKRLATNSRLREAEGHAGEAGQLADEGAGATRNRLRALSLWGQQQKHYKCNGFKS